MPGLLPFLVSRPWKRRVGLLVVGAVAFAVAAWCCRDLVLHRATAQQAAKGTNAVPVEPPATAPSDYASRVVAYIHNTQAITRQELGEYLILRYGFDKLPLLINKRLIDEECKKHGIVVTAAEVDAALAEDIKNLGVDQASFVKTVLARSKKNLYEWKEDVLRPRLQMTRLVQPHVHITQEDLRRGFESVYGEKVECRMILWPLDQDKQSLEEYEKVRVSEAAFAEKAKNQPTSQLASAGGKIKPIARYALDETLEKEAFKLRPGQVSPRIRTPQGFVVLKCDRRIPADTTVNFESVKDKLEKEIGAHKLQHQMALVFQSLRERARPQVLLKKLDRQPKGPTPPPTQVVAYLHGNQPVTREELGEFLIARHGAEKVQYLVNRRIIDRECEARKIVISDDEVEKALQEDLKMLNCDEKHFQKEVLGKWGKSLFEWREDVIRPRLMLTKLCEGRVKYTEEDIQKGFEAYYGERLECRMILWPPEQAKFAMAEYARIRDSEEEFTRKAKSQASSTLAAHGGKIPMFGRHTLGDENLEREAFKLQPGEITSLIGTPQGQVVLKCDKRIPPDKTKKLEEERPKLIKEVMERKVQLEMQVVFKELHTKASPRYILKSANQVEDLLGNTKRLLSNVPPVGATPGK